MSKINTYSGVITELQPNQVFVFGANQSGFHGAGSAGFASFGLFGNHWRSQGYGAMPNGTKGRWAVKGKLGAMVGTHGRSYGIVTVTRPGAKRSISPSNMVDNIALMYQCARDYPQYTFFVAQSHKTGLNGYTGAEMASFFVTAGVIPDNVHFEQQFADLFNV